MADRTDDPTGTAALAVTVVTWAAAFPAIRLGIEGYAPWALGLLRLLAASVALGAAAIFARPARPPRRLWLRVVACGLLGQTLYQGLLMTGERSVPAGTASVLIATAPVFSVIAAGVLLRESIAGRWSGFLVAFAGAALAGSSLGGGGGSMAVVVLIAAVCQGLYHVAVKPLAEELGAFGATAWSLLAGTLLALPALPWLVHDAGSASLKSTGAALFLGVVPSALGYATWSFAVARSSVARSTVALYLVPVVAILLGWAALGERPSLRAVGGGVLAVLGVVLVRRRPRVSRGTRAATA